MTLPSKTARYTLRLHPAMLSRLRQIADELGTSLPDLLCTGALIAAAHATTPAAYLFAKAGAMVPAPLALPKPPDAD